MTDRDKLIERARALSELDEGLIGEAMGERPRRRLGLRAAAAAAAALLITGLALILSLYHGGRKNAKEVSIATELPYATHEASVTEPPATPLPLPSEAPTEGPAASAAPASSAAPTDNPSPKATGKPKTCVFASEDEFVAAVRGADEADKLLYGIDRYFVPAAVPEDAELDGIRCRRTRSLSAMAPENMNSRGSEAKSRRNTSALSISSITEAGKGNSI